jgi:plasmid stabilization system protein ParE
MKVHWTDTAQEHLAAIHTYIAQDSREYATRMVDRLTRRSQQIAGFPLSGRRVPEYDMEALPSSCGVFSLLVARDHALRTAEVGRYPTKSGG